MSAHHIVIQSAVAVGATAGSHVESGALPDTAMQELVAREVEKVRRELMNTVHSLEEQVTELSTRLATLENRV